MSASPEQVAHYTGMAREAEATNRYGKHHRREAVSADGILIALDREVYDRACVLRFARKEPGAHRRTASPFITFVFDVAS